MAVVAHVVLRGVSREQYDAVRTAAGWLERAPAGACCTSPGGRDPTATTSTAGRARMRSTRSAGTGSAPRWPRPASPPSPRSRSTPRTRYLLRAPSRSPEPDSAPGSRSAAVGPTHGTVAALHTSRGAVALQDYAMRITSVDIIPIYPRLVPQAAAYNAHFPNWNLRTVFRVRTDNGLVGYGDFRCQPPPDSVAAPLVGKSPFDFIGADLNPGLGAALYDVMGKHLDLPAHKLMGQQVRRRVSAAAWTKPVPPETLAQEVCAPPPRATPS